MCADIFTKGFTESDKWKLVCSLICVIDPAELRGLAQKTREIVADPDGLTVETSNKGKGATKESNGDSGHETGRASAVPTKKSTPTSSSSSTPSTLSTTTTTTPNSSSKRQLRRQQQTLQRQQQGRVGKTARQGNGGHETAAAASTKGQKEGEQQQRHPPLQSGGTKTQKQQSLCTPGYYLDDLGL